MPHDPFTDEEIWNAFFMVAGGACECCGKTLSYGNQEQGSGPGEWEAHRGGKSSPVILCTGSPEECHLRCGHNGDYQNPGITPRYHR